MSSNQPDEALAADLDASLAFLRRLPGRVHLVAISPDGGGIEGKLFSPTRADGTRKEPRERAEEIRSWIDQRNRSKNCYFTCNVVAPDFKGPKPTDDDIAELRMLKVDLDPLPVPADWSGTAEEWIDRERSLILASLTTDLPEGVPGLPSLVLDSGSGLWGMWVFRVHGEAIAGDTVRRCGEKLIELYRAKLGKQRVDGVADLSRIARLPGTLNHPGERKRKKGRRLALARVVEEASSDQRRYEPLVFLTLEEQAARLEARKPSKRRARGRGSKSSTTIGTLDDLRALDTDARNLEPQEANARNLCKVVIAQGCDPEHPGRFGGAPSMFGIPCGTCWDGNRSDAVFYVCCELIRRGVDDDTIRALLLDEGWGISSYILTEKDGRARRDPEGHAQRQIDNAREKVGEVDAAADDGGGDRPVILTNPGRHAEIVDEAERALLGAGVPVYQRGPELVRPVVLDRSTAEGGVTRARGATVIQPVTVAWLHDAMSRSARWRYRKEKSMIPDDPLEKHARTLLARAGAWSFPVLRGIVTAPTLREDGSILQVPGYDAASGLIFEPGGATFPPVPEHPTRDEAVAALAMLDPLFAKFPFVDEAARSVVLSAVLSGLVGRVLPAIPMHAFDAPAAGTGKSLLAETVGAIVLGHKPSAMNQGKEEAEDEKRLATALRAGDPIIWIDNAERVIAGDTICSILTQESVLLRILGRSEQVALPCNVLVMATGNNLTLGGDVTRRSLVCRLDAKEERPDQREFDFNPKLVAAERRAELVVAGLTVLRAYIAAGRPGRLAPVGSFERWSEWVREALVWCGRGDPDETRTAVLDDDPRRAELVEVLEAWRGAWGDSELTVSEVRVADELRDLLIEVTGRPTWNGRSIGKWLKRQVDRVVAGLVLRRAGSRGGVARWRVDAVDGRAPVRGLVPEQDDSDADVIG